MLSFDAGRGFEEIPITTEPTRPEEEGCSAPPARALDLCSEYVQTFLAAGRREFADCVEADGGCWPFPVYDVCVALDMSR